MAPKTRQVHPSLFGGAGEVGTSGAMVASAMSAGKRLQKKSPPPCRRSNRTKAGGGDPGEGTPRKKPRGTSPGCVLQINRPPTEAATKPPQEDTSVTRRARMVRAAVRTAEANAGAVDKGSNGDKAAASAARRAYAASGFASDPKAATPAVRRVRTARGGVGTAEAHTGPGDKGADGDEVGASATRLRRAPRGARTRRAAPLTTPRP